MPLRQRASLIRDRFTVKSPKLMVFFELSAQVGGAVEQLFGSDSCHFYATRVSQTPGEDG